MWKFIGLIEAVGLILALAPTVARALEERPGLAANLSNTGVWLAFGTAAVGLLAAFFGF